MIKVMATVHGRRTLFLGLDRNNAERLLEGNPIPVDVAEMLDGAPLFPDVQDVVLCGRETLAELHAELSEYLPMPPFEEPSPDG